MKGSTVLSILTSAWLISFCIAIGPFNPESDGKLSPKPNYQFDGENTLFREGDIVGDPFKPKSDLFDEAAAVGKTWKDGRIPYTIDCSLKYMLTAVTALRDAIDEWESKTCIRFVPKEDNDMFHVTFLRSAGCWASYVGFHGKNTTVSIGNGCEYKHVMVHELGHVIGFWHEQSRPDRDNYVSVVSSNVLPSLLYNFDKVTSKTQTHGEAYDYESIMHYPLNAFAINPNQKTLIPHQDLRGKEPYIKLSESDVIQTNRMYKCDIKPAVGAAKDAKVKKDDTCIDERDECVLWAEHNHCETNPEPLLVHCRKSCKNCGPCVNKPRCPVFYNYAFCVKRATSSMRDCKALCRVCVPDPTTAPTTAAKTTPATTTPATTTPATTTPATTTPATTTPATTTPATTTPATTTPATTTPATTTPATTTPATTTPATTTPATTTPATTTPATTTPATTTPATTTEATTTAATTTAQATEAPTLLPTEITEEIRNSEIQPASKKYIGVICEDRSEYCAVWKKDGRCESDDWVTLNCLISCNRVDICDLEALKPSGSCATPLGLSLANKDVQKIPDNNFESSSFFRPGGGWGAFSKAGRLYLTDDHTTRTVGAWCADPNLAVGSFLEVDLGKLKRINGVATQGRDVYFEHVRTYEIAYKKYKNEDWKTYSIDGKTKVCTGNCDHFTPVLNILEYAIIARFVRIYPKTYRGTPCLRVELYGCDA